MQRWKIRNSTKENDSTEENCIDKQANGSLCISEKGLLLIAPLKYTKQQPKE